MIEIKKLTKFYGKTKIVDGLNLSIKKGSIFGFLGPNGAGKTTTIKILTGINKPTKGSVLINTASPSDPKCREKIGYMPEDPYFYDQLSGKEFLSFIGSLFKTKAASNYSSNKVRSSQPSVSNNKNTSDKIDSLLEKVGLKEAGKKKIVEYSKGMKQRLGLAQAMINSPDYLFLDEPLDGLDPIGRREFKEILLGLKKEGRTIFFNSHILSDVEEICDQIGIINQGKLIYSGNVKSFRKNQTLEDAFVDKISAISN